MSDGVLAAIIAAGATVFTSFVQLRTSLAKEIAARGRPASARGKSHLLPILLVAMLAGATVGGFALSQWMNENERAVQQALVRDLRERIGDLTRYKNDIEQSRAELRSIVAADVLRRIGAAGVAVLATAAPCRPTAAASPSGATPAATVPSPSPAAATATTAAAPGACTESDAAPIVLCATIPAAAQLGSVELYVRQNDTAGRWIDTRAMPGEESAKARFAAKPVELADSPTTKQVCIGFTQWSDQARTARMVVHYAL